MFFKGTGHRQKLLVALSLFACIAVTLVLYHEESDILDIGWKKKPDYAPGTGLREKSRKVLLPSGSQIPEQVLRVHLRGTSSEHWESFQLPEADVLDTPPHKPGDFKISDSLLYAASPGATCVENEHKFKLGADDSQHMALNQSRVFEMFFDEADTYDDSYNQHLRGFLEEYMTENKEIQHWYRFSGSSVWLSDYNVHLVVSRMILTKTGDKKHPEISLTLAQIFDESWQEVPDVRVVFPSNTVENAPGFRVGNQDYHSYRFPRFLPISFPFKTESKYWGPEDPRVTLVRSKQGHEEPVVVFNAYHENQSDTGEGIELHGFRSIFMSLPFQVQKGKQIEGADTDQTRDMWFTRTKQLHVQGEQDKKVEKNWIPFVSGAGAHHEHVSMLTSLDPLKIITCELWTDNGICASETSTNDDSVSPLRGGTPLLSIKTIDTEDTEYFAGIARAHLKDCGCGHDFYRPNLIVVSRKGKTWSLSHVSSSLDFGITDLLPSPKSRACERESVVIPNGIEFWDLDRDLMSVDVSASDATVERVLVTGLLRAIEDSMFWKNNETESLSDTVKCALESSREFCRKFGIEDFAAFEKTNRI